MLKKGVSSVRKIAIGTWSDAYDPSVYGTMELRMDEAVRYIEAFRAKTGRKLTVSYLMARAAAEVLYKPPDANAVLRWNRVYLRKRIGVFFQVVITDQGEDKVDLSGATLYEVEQKSLVPLVPYSRVPILLAIGAVKDSAVVENGEIKVARTMNVNATFDHRFIDGFHAAAMSRILKKWMEHPFEHFDKLEDFKEVEAPTDGNGPTMLAG